jgi:hypothetical protein
MPESRPNSNFGGRNSRGGNDNHSRDRKFGGGGGAPRTGGFGAPRSGFAGAPRDAGGGGYQNNGGGFAPRDDRSGGGAREGFSYERKGGFNDRFAGGARNEGAAPRGDFAARKPAFGKPSFAKPGNGGKVFVPRDAQKRPAKTAR